MTSLAAIQRAFQASVLDGTEDAEVHVMGADSDDVRSRLDVYRYAYPARLQEVLADDFPALRNQLGPDAFAALALAHVRSRRSAHRNVRWYGEEFPAFVAATRDTAAGNLAQLEWMIGLAFDAPDAPVITHEALGTIAAHAWPGARFVLHPSTRRAELLSGTAATWRRLQLGDDDRVTRNDAGTEPLVIWRKRFEPHFRNLSADEAWAIDATLRGEGFAAICEGMCQWHAPEEAAGRAATLLSNWIGDEMISRIEV